MSAPFGAGNVLLITSNDTSDIVIAEFCTLVKGNGPLRTVSSHT